MNSPRARAIPSAADAFPSSPGTPLRARRMLAVVLGVLIVLPLSVAGTSVLLPPIARDLGAQPGLLQWVVNAFNLSFALSTLVWGPLADRFGLRRIFLINAGVLAAGAVASALAPTLVVLDISRAVAGIGAGAIQVTAAAIISTTLTGAARAKAFGMLGTVLGFGLAFGPTISGAVAGVAGWRAVFLLPLLPLVVAFVLRGDVPRPAEGPVREPASAMPGKFSMRRSPRFIAICLVTVVQSVAFITLLTYLPTAFSALWGLDEGETGLWMLLMTAPVLLLPALGARVVMSRSARGAFGVIFTALGCAIAGSAVLCVAVGRDPGAAALLAGMVLLGASFGLPLGIIDAEALSCAPPMRQAQAAGALNFIRLSSEAVAVAAYGLALGFAVHAAGDDDATAERVIAGSAERPDWFADAFQHIQLGVVVVTVALSLLVVVFHRLSCREP